ncbi:hypothetical protein N480_23915 [Pseudoalteromonas luteoviolacea S2607]|uniref:hypothetical protein n=1 Tax=Pseudoalteromonas luteoviolacea TaxID=43657 RepID=UPI0007B08159|nr:hypothetical protein [Pseudoalteromonas luteoviolacea]KZN33572.1 hypothetical protein N480_23915 [Pseudoalteromonas luteoviolacea S2607]
MYKNVFPGDLNLDKAVSFLVCNWSSELEDELLNINEGLFNHYSLKPILANGSCDDKTTDGKYSRVRKKLLDFLRSEASFVDFRLVSEPDYQDDFFPSKLLAAFSLDKEALNQGIFSARETSNDITSEDVVDVYEGYLNKLGLFYGGVFLFPAKYGPDYYLSSINAMPKGTKFGSNDEYVRRLNNWRENSGVAKFYPLNGYFREIYQYNFIVESHLNKRFAENTMKEFMESNGSLIQLNNDIPQFLWSIETGRLAEIGEALETSGLVLSSDTKPL